MKAIKVAGDRLFNFISVLSWNKKTFCVIYSLTECLGRGGFGITQPRSYFWLLYIPKGSSERKLCLYCCWQQYSVTKAIRHFVLSVLPTLKNQTGKRRREVVAVWTFFHLSAFILTPRSYIVNLATRAIWITATSALVSAICISGSTGPPCFFWPACIFYFCLPRSMWPFPFLFNASFILIHYTDLLPS